jgi:hypothetical protein
MAAIRQTSSAKVSHRIHLATPVLFQISLSSVCTDSTFPNQNVEQSPIPVTQAFISAKPAPPLRNSGGSIALKYPENDFFGVSVAPLVFVGIKIIVSAVSQFCTYGAKTANMFWHRSVFSKAFVMLLLVAQTALFVPEVRVVASERVIMSQVPQAAAIQATLLRSTPTFAPSGGKITLQFPMGRHGNVTMARCGMMDGPHLSGSILRRTGNGEKAQEAVNFPDDDAIAPNVIDDAGFTQFAMLNPSANKYYGATHYTMCATCNSKNHIQLNFSDGKYALWIKNESSETLWMVSYIGSSFSETCWKFVNFAFIGYHHVASTLGFPSVLRFIPDYFNGVSRINTLVHAINSGPLCAQHLDDSDRLETAWTVPNPFKFDPTFKRVGEELFKIHTTCIAPLICISIIVSACCAYAQKRCCPALERGRDSSKYSKTPKASKLKWISMHLIRHAFDLIMRPTLLMLIALLPNVIVSQTPPITAVLSVTPQVLLESHSSITITGSPFAAGAVCSALFLDGSVANNCSAVSLVEIVVTLNVNAPAARPFMLLPVINKGIIFEASVAFFSHYVFIGPLGMCIMGSTSTVVFSISSYDCIVGKANATLMMILLLVTSAILSGGSITLVQPTNFFASSVAPVVSAGASSIPDLNIACGVLNSTAVVLTTSGVDINAFVAAFRIQIPAASGSNLVFLTGIGLGLLVAGFCAQVISLPLVIARLGATVNFTVRAPPFRLLRLLLQQEARIDYF